MCWTGKQFLLIGLKKSALISFKIGNITYKAEQGMTWTQWCNSTYNTDDYYIGASKVYSDDGTMYVANSSNTAISSTSTITSGGTYKLWS